MHLARRSTLVIAVALVAAGLGTVAAIAAPGRTPRTTTNVTVASTQAFTDTGIALTSGETFSVSASGTVRWRRNGPLVGPAGYAFTNSVCAGNQYGDSTGFTVTGLHCYSLIGRIGSTGVIFYVGPSGFSLTSPVAGELYLGFNDDLYTDNTGSFSATVTTP
jgi:hypothetical protein